MAKIILFDRPNFEGEKHFHDHDVPHLGWPDDRHVGSLIVIEGTWNLYHHHEYGAPAYTVDASGGRNGNGVYYGSDEWGVGGGHVHSVKIVGAFGNGTPTGK